MDVLDAIDQYAERDSPSLYDIHRSFNHIKTKRYNGIKGEIYNRMIVFTSFVLGKNSLILEGQRSSGKSNIMYVVAEYCPNPMTVDRASDKAHRRNQQLNNSTHLVVPEVNKVDNSFLESLKDFGEGKESTYTYTDEYKIPRTINLEPKPFITSRADENDMSLGEELVSRLIILKTDSSVSMNKDVISYKFKRAQNPFKKDSINNKDVEFYKRYVKSLPNIKDLTFIYTPGEAMAGAIPSLFSDARRDTDKYLNNTYGITLFHYGNRMTKEINGKTCVFVTPADVWYNHVIFSDALIKSALKCTGTERKVLNILKQNADEHPHKPDMKVREIHQTLIDNGITAGMTTVDNYCKNLYKNGYIIRNESTRPYTYEASKDFFSFEFNIDWKQVIEESKRYMQQNFPDIADEYIRRYCNDPEVIHPFTGETIKIKDWTDNNDDVKLTQKKKTIFDVTDTSSKKQSITEQVKKDIDDGKDANDIDEKYGENKMKSLVQQGEVYEENGYYKKLE